MKDKLAMGGISRKRQAFYAVLVLMIMGLEIVLHPAKRDVSFVMMGYGVVDTGWRTIKKKMGLGQAVLGLGLWGAASFVMWLVLYFHIGRLDY